MINTIIVVVLGAIAGILVNYLADVLPLTRRLSAPLCRECGHQFQLGEYLFAWRCSQCQSRPPFRNYLVVIGMMLLSFLVAVFPIKGLSFWAAIPLFAFLILILTIDMEYRAVLNETSIAGAILMLIFGVFMNGIVKTLLGGVAGYGAMLLLYFGGILFTRVLSKIRHQEIDEVALGFGDVNVTGFLGLLVGWPDILSTLVVAILLGGVISLLIILGLLLTKRYQAFSAIPYTPFLILAAIFVLFVR